MEDNAQATLSPDGSTDDLWRSAADDEPLAEAHTSALTRHLIVHGKPMTWARTKPRFEKGNWVGARTPDDRRNRMNLIGLQWKERHHRPYEKGTPLAVQLIFVFPRPKSHFGTGRNAAVMKHDARHLRPGRGKNGGDVDNLAKLVLDALGDGVAYADDAQIAELQLSKRYVGGEETPHTYIEISPLFPY